jgi:hypothetical protein
MAFPGWWRRHFMAFEGAIAVGLLAVLVYWVERRGGGPVIDQLLSSNRAAVYTAIASILGALLGFVMTAISIVLAFSAMERLEVLRQSPHYKTLWSVFTQTTWLLAAATGCALAALVFDRESAPCRIALYLCALTALLSAVRIARCVWVLEQLVTIIVNG